MTSLARGPHAGDARAGEGCRSDVIARLAKAGVIVSAGHTAARYETLERRRERQGLPGFTHLFNAMPPLAGPRAGAGRRGARRCRCLVSA